MAQTETSRRKLIDILAQVSNETGVSVDDIIGPTKRALYVKARSFFARIAHGEGYKLIDIGEALGGRSHTAVLEYLKEEGEKDMTKDELRKRIAGLNKEERKALVQEIAEGGTKEERDNLAALFSSSEGGTVADLEKAGGSRKPSEQVHEETTKKKPGFLDDIDI